ncbi:MAG: sodium/glutamate symporter, partial [Psychromonas sp.]
MDNIIEVGVSESLITAILVLFIGRLINLNPKLAKFNIPEPILGGLVVAILITVLHQRGIT